MTSTLNESGEDALATFRHHQALARYNLAKADQAMKRFLDIVAYGKDEHRTGSVPGCVRLWAEWLSKNGPSLKATITEATGVKFTERGTPHTIMWRPGDATEGTNTPPNTIVRIRGQKDPGEGRGAPPTIYALWSQRYDVRDLFGVGPGRPGCPSEGCPRPAGEGTGHYGSGACSRHEGSVADLAQREANALDQSRLSKSVVIIPDHLTYDWGRPEDLDVSLKELVSQPVSDLSADQWADAIMGEDPEAADQGDFSTTASDVRYMTLEDWIEAYSDIFDIMVATGDKPPPETSKQTTKTLPHGIDPSVAIAMAYQAAVRRRREAASDWQEEAWSTTQEIGEIDPTEEPVASELTTLLGVVRPPEVWPTVESMGPPPHPDAWPEQDEEGRYIWRRGEQQVLDGEGDDDG